MEFPEDMAHDVLDVDEACVILRCTKDWLYDMTQAKQIGHLKRGRKTYFFRYHLLDYLKRCEVPAEV